MSDASSTVAAGAAGDGIILIFGRASVIMAMIVSGWMGWSYWIGRGEIEAALFVLVFEVAGVVALHFVVKHWRARRFGWAAATALVLAGSVCFCGYTNMRKFQAAEAAERAAAIEQSQEYVQARVSLAASDSALRQHLAATPPSCTCPATIEAWTVSHERRLVILNQQRSDDQSRLDALNTPAQINILALFAIAIEFLKVVGFTIFANDVGASGAGVVANRKDARPWRLGMLGLGATATSLGAQVAAAPAAQTPTPKIARDVAGVERDADPQSVRALKAAQARSWALERVPKTEIARRLGVHRNTVHNWLRL